VLRDMKKSAKIASFATSGGSGRLRHVHERDAAKGVASYQTAFAIGTAILRKRHARVHTPCSGAQAPYAPTHALHAARNEVYVR
jgi:hypothetical protein